MARLYETSAVEGGRETLSLPYPSHGAEYRTFHKSSCMTEQSMHHESARCLEKLRMISVASCMIRLTTS
jgi:hypothetical protein